MDELLDFEYGKKGSKTREKWERGYQFDLAAERIGEALKMVRKNLNLTQDELSKVVNVSPTVISKMENDMFNLTLQNVASYLTAMNCELTLRITVNRDKIREGRIVKEGGKPLASESIKIIH